jgi:hypothetical protein
MSGLVYPLVPPVVLPTRAEGRARTSRSTGRPLPLPALVARRTRTTIYGLARVDDRGRVSDRAIIRALGWTGRTQLTIRVEAGRVAVAEVSDGECRLAGRDRVLLPAQLRCTVGIEPGDRVLLAAEPADGLLVVHPPASLDAMLNSEPSPVQGDAA